MHASEQINWSPGVTLEDVEKQVIIKAFRFFGNNKTTTANALGIAIRTLDTKLEKYKADTESDKERETNESKRRDDFLRRSRGPRQDANGAAILAPEEPASKGNNPASGAHVESASNIPAQQSLPVYEQPQIQKVLHEQTPTRSHNRRR